MGFRGSVLFALALAVCGAAGCSGADDGAPPETSQDEIRGSIGGERTKDVARAYRAAKMSDLKVVPREDLPGYVHQDAHTLEEMEYRVTAIRSFVPQKRDLFYLVEFATRLGARVVYFYDHTSKRVLMSLWDDKTFYVIGSTEKFEM